MSQRAGLISKPYSKAKKKSQKNKVIKIRKIRRVEVCHIKVHIVDS